MIKSYRFSTVNKIVEEKKVCGDFWYVYSRSPGSVLGISTLHNKVVGWLFSHLVIRVCHMPVEGSLLHVYAALYTLDIF